MSALDATYKEPIRAFAEQHRLRTSHDTDGTTVIRGPGGCHLYEYSDSELALLILSDGEDTRVRRWTGIRKKCLANGMTLRQNGDDEGALSFDPADRKQSRLAIKVTGVRPKRQISPEHRATLVAVGFQKRETLTLQGVPSAQTPLEKAQAG